MKKDDSKLSAGANDDNQQMPIDSTLSQHSSKPNVVGCHSQQVSTGKVVMKEAWPFKKIMDIFYEIEAIDESTAEEFLHVASRAFVVRN